ncbi:TRAP transporter small permease [uncultured Roseibium sp.]|uniref:TRAP transporter small permease n=1 Tax=uncultured Roseibium sp. TaxID=1936171 RepID=UPI002608689B|nr:TRAP transporter small permease [uncultured Roseibium sp.]
MSEAPQKKGIVRSLLATAITILENISGIVILIMMLLTFADVIGRYVFHSPIFGGTEIISALLALAIFSGLGVINARDDHITVELFEPPIKRLMTPFVYEITIQIFSVFCMALIAVVLFEHAWESYTLQKLTVVLEMPLYYVTATIAVFAVISVVSQVAGVALKILNLKKSAAGSSE